MIDASILISSKCNSSDKGTKLCYRIAVIGAMFIFVADVKVTEFDYIFRIGLCDAIKKNESDVRHHQIKDIHV